MLFQFHHRFRPLWALTFCVVAVSTLPRVLPSLLTLFVIAGIELTMLAIARRPRPRQKVRPLIPCAPVRPGLDLTAGVHARTLEDAINMRALRADAADPGRNGDDSGWAPAIRPALTSDPSHHRVRKLT